MANPYRPLPPGVQRFRLDPAASRAVETRVALRRLPMLAIVGAVAVAGAAIGLRSSLVIVIPAVAITFLMGAARLAKARQTAEAAAARYELLISDRVLCRTVLGQVSEVLRPEVSEIVETPLGLWLSCAKPARSLFVSRAVDGYADVRARLATWGPIRDLRGWAAILLARREIGRQGPRDAIQGTALAENLALAEELVAVRAAAIGPGPLPFAPVPIAGGHSWKSKLVLGWAGLIVMFLVIWQVLSPEDHAPKTDGDCSRWCAQWGLCRAQDGRCVAATDADCLQSMACKKLGNCVALDGRCHVRSIAPASSSSSTP